MFRGVQHINMDAKGRLAIPARQREPLLSSSSGQVVVTIDTQVSCLLIYPLPVWEQLEKDIQNLTAVYQAMKPKDAAALFETMSPDFAAGFLGRMPPDSAAAILSGMSAEAAYGVSVIVAGRNADVPKD